MSKGTGSPVNGSGPCAAGPAHALSRHPGTQLAVAGQRSLPCLSLARVHGLLQSDLCSSSSLTPHSSSSKRCTALGTRHPSFIVTSSFSFSLIHPLFTTSVHVPRPRPPPYLISHPTPASSSFPDPPLRFPGPRPPHHHHQPPRPCRLAISSSAVTPLAHHEPDIKRCLSLSLHRPPPNSAEPLLLSVPHNFPITHSRFNIAAGSPLT